MKRTIALFSFAAVLAITAFTQAGAAGTKATCCNGCCGDKCGQTCCKGGCTDSCCKGK